MLWRALHPMRANGLGHGVYHSHAVIVKLPEMSALEKVGFSIDVLEGGINAARHSTPHPNVSWVVQLNSTYLIVVAPVFVS